jgi:hypothetical protein
MDLSSLPTPGVGGSLGRRHHDPTHGIVENGNSRRFVLAGPKAGTMNLMQSHGGTEFAA